MPYVMGAQMSAHHPHPPCGLGLVRLYRPHESVFHALQVVRVAQERLPQLTGGTGELGKDECAAQVDPGRHVLLGHQIHAVSQGSHHHHVGRTIQGDQFTATVRLMKVVHSGHADPPMITIDPTHLALDFDS